MNSRKKPMSDREYSLASKQLREYELLSTAIHALNVTCDAQFQNTIDASVRRTLYVERDRLNQRLANLHREILGDPTP